MTMSSTTCSSSKECAAADTDYEVYEGTLASPFTYSHAEKLCTTGGATTATVVPRNLMSEGSYGKRSGGAELPQGAPACLPQQIAITCP